MLRVRTHIDVSVRWGRHLSYLGGPFTQVIKNVFHLLHLLAPQFAQARAVKHSDWAFQQAIGVEADFHRRRIEPRWKG